MTNQLPNKDAPIFVRGLSRSGGTLMVTILDSHPKVAMSYELYPHLLAPQVNADSRPLWRRVAEYFSPRHRKSVSLSPNIRKFLAYAARSGITLDIFERLVNQKRDQGLKLETSEGRLKLVEACARYKMSNAGKQIWGSKCTSHFEEYAEVWPQARFLNILRDGRDVLASQLNTGSFKPDPKTLGESWAKHHIRFKDLVDTGRIKGYIVRYEALVTNPQREIQAICDFLDLEFSATMLNHHQQELTIYQSNHLSMNQIVNPISSSQIGRWKKDLSLEQLEQFESVAGDCLDAFGYERTSHAHRS